MPYKEFLDLHEVFNTSININISEVYGKPIVRPLSEILEGYYADWPGLYYTLDINNNLIRISAIENLENTLQKFIPNDEEITLVCHIAWSRDKEYRYKSMRSAKQKIKRVALTNYNAGFGYTFIGSPDIRDKFKGIRLFF